MREKIINTDVCGVRRQMSVINDKIWYSDALIIVGYRKFSLVFPQNNQTFAESKRFIQHSFMIGLL